jgi:hypothetical protein
MLSSPRQLAKLPGQALVEALFSMLRQYPQSRERRDVVGIMSK